MRNILTVVLCAFLALNGCTAWAKQFVVDQRQAAALDTNDGSSLHPWKTIAHAARTVRAGDTVFVRDGTYRESIEVVNSGSSADQMITFQAESSNVVIKGSDLVDGWKLWKGAAWKKEHWSENSQQVFVDGVPLRQIGGNSYYSPQRLPAEGRNVNDLAAGTFFYDAKGLTLFIWLKDGSNPAGHQIEASVRPWLFLVKRKSYIRLSGFNFQHSNTTAVIKSGWPAVNISGDNCIAENNTISWCDFTGLGGNGNNLTITNNRADYNGNSGMGFSGRNIVIKGNTTSYNNYRKFDISWHAGGMKNTQLTDSIITRHTARGNIGQGIWCDVDCDRVEISDSTVCDNTQTGIIYEISKHGRIFNNIVYSNGSVGIYLSASSGCNVINNIASGNFRGITLHGVPRTNSNIKYGLRDNKVLNNIIINNKDADLVIAPDSQDAVNNSADYNLYYKHDGKAQFKLGYGRLVKGLSSWQVATGNDAHSNEAMPLFTDLSRQNFRPVAGSPVLGKGSPNTEVKSDYDGSPRDRTSNDIGPFRFHSTQ